MERKKADVSKGTTATINEVIDLTDEGDQHSKVRTCSASKQLGLFWVLFNAPQLELFKFPNKCISMH